MLVAHTAFGRVSVLDAATLTVVGQVSGLGEPRYAAMHPTERLAYVSDSKRGAVAVIDLVGLRIVGRALVPGPARHLSLSADGLRLWVALGTKATHVAILDVSHPGAHGSCGRFSRRFSRTTCLGARGRACLGDVGLALRDRGLRAQRAGAPEAPARRLRTATRRVPRLPRLRCERRGRVGAGAPSRRQRRAPGRDVPAGSYNISFGGPNETFAKPAGVTPSLDRGTVCLLSPAGAVRHIRRVARSAHDACIVEAG